MNMLTQPGLIVHCDWSKEPRKRWMAIAEPVNGLWKLHPPEPVDDTQRLLERLTQRFKPRGSMLLGFDFPIGLPAAYGERTPFAGFKDALAQVGTAEWADWFVACDQEDEISILRPFYPMRPGGRKMAYLLDGLGFSERESIVRRCEKKTATRQAACILFWTLGGNQVGKAAASGWQEILQPNLAAIGLWPFDGPLHGLLEKHSIVIAETYPGEVYSHLAIPRNPAWSKRKQAGRKSVAPALLAWIAQRGHLADPALTDLINCGFVDSGAGEDQFDAIVGLFGMLDVVSGQRPEGLPERPEVRKWEGWILGRQDSGVL